MYIFNIFMLYILYLYFSAYSIKLLLKIQLKILFNLNKKSSTHIWVTGPPRKHTRHPDMTRSRGDERVKIDLEGNCDEIINFKCSCGITNDKDVCVLAYTVLYERLHTCFWVSEVYVQTKYSKWAPFAAMQASILLKKN